ncbi:MAG: acylphosphatase [Rubrivivax sp.]|nr:acylphosphatase [Rubrivivax sp.]
MTQPATVQHLVIHGRVQGVGYRWAMVEQAAQLGLRGWVRNRRNGTVEAVVAGPAEAVQRMIEWARRGPRGAAVSRVDAQPAEDDGTFEGFEQRPTA